MQRMKQHTPNMLQGPLLPSIIRYTVPVILTSLLQLLFNAADLMVVGQYRGSIALAAVSTTTSVINLILGMFLGLSTGVSVAVAYALGSRRNSAVSQAVHTTTPLAVVGGVIVAVVGCIISKPVLEMMETPVNVMPLSLRYMRIIFIGKPFALLYNFNAAILRAAGDTKRPLYYLTGSGILNVLLNLIFVVFFHMNVEGVAIATVISQVVSAVFVTVALMRRTDACKLELKKIRFHKDPLKKILRIGLPAGIQSSLFSLANVTIQASINSFGEVFMSGNGAAANIEGFIYAIQHAFSMTAVNFIGQNAGAHQYRRIKKVMFTCLYTSVLVTFSLCLLVRLFGTQLLSIYVSDSPESIQVGLQRFARVTTLYFMYAMMDTAAGSLRGMGVSLTPMLVSLIGVCGFRILWVNTIFKIPHYHTPKVLYLCWPISWVVTCACHMLVFAIVYRRKYQKLKQTT